MKEAFNGFCKGSLELLAGRALPMLAEHVRSGEPLESFITVRNSMNRAENGGGVLQPKRS